MENLNTNIHSINEPSYELELITPMPSEHLDHIINLYIEGDLRSLRKLGSGTNGLVFEYEEYAIKLLYNSDDYEDSNDVQVLKDLHHLSCIPTLYAVIDNTLLIVEKIEGHTVSDYCGYYSRAENYLNIDEGFISKWEDALLDIIEEGYTPDDLHSQNVMISVDTITPKIVDVGWFFKHNERYESRNSQEIKSNYGYVRAQRWTGSELRDYVYGY